MKTFVALVVIQAVAGLTSTVEPCSPYQCKREKGCVCSSQQSPVATSQTPQFVTLNFDDAVTDQIYKLYYEPYLFNRKNPDGSPIGATFYVPHVYTDYERVNGLYNQGFEIAVDSISKNVEVEYWANASVKTLIAEFQGQKQILEHFANISAKDIQGVRTPHFQVAGNTTFEAYRQSGLSYDNSIPALSRNKYFPYTLDYLSGQQFLVGVKPSQSFAGFWVAPINNLVSPEGTECNVLLSCIGPNASLPTDADWLISQFKNTYETNRAPLNILLGQGWFARDKNLEAFEEFLNYVGNKKDVYLVSNSEVIRWTKNPTPLGEYKPVHVTRSRSCSPKSCPLKFGEQEEIRYMKSCVPCPQAYPWVGNPLGQA